MWGGGVAVVVVAGSARTDSVVELRSLLESRFIRVPRATRLLSFEDLP